MNLHLQTFLILRKVSFPVFMHEKKVGLKKSINKLELSEWKSSHTKLLKERIQT